MIARSFPPKPDLIDFLFFEMAFGLLFVLMYLMMMEAQSLGRKAGDKCGNQVQLSTILERRETYLLIVLLFGMESMNNLWKLKILMSMDF